MSMTFTKLFSSITESTVWCEPERTRLVWITMLAMADRKGRVWASLPGLANRARVPVEDCQIAIDTFLAPDRYSRTAEHEGRRIEPIDGGWKLINYEKYRELKDEETIRESKRKYMQNKRAAAKQNVTIRAENVHVIERNSGNTNPQWTQAEAEAEAVKQHTQESFSIAGSKSKATP